MNRAVVGLLLVVIAGGAVFMYRNPPGADAQSVPLMPTLPSGIGALGRLEPKSEVLKVNAPSTMEPAVVEKLLVEVGDQVSAGQILAVLDSNKRELADVETARASLALAEKILDRVLAGAKPGDIAAQEAMVERTRERMALSEKQLERTEQLAKKNAVTQDDIDVRRADVEMERRELRHHEAALAALKEVRDVDVEVAQAEVAKSRAALQRAEADLEVSLIRSPLAATILRIHVRMGERVGNDGLLDLGDTSIMDVVAEVHETDILRVHLNQPAEVMVRNLNRKLSGRVIEIGKIIGRKDVLSNDPVDDTDARVIEVRIRLTEEDSKIVSGLSWAKVEVRIDETLEQDQTSLTTNASLHNTTLNNASLNQEKGAAR
jgi:HlyD family secretion protein